MPLRGDPAALHRARIGGKDSPVRARAAARVVRAADGRRAQVSAAAGLAGLARLLLHWFAATRRWWNETTMESILGVHEAALLFRARRMEVLAANLANADTPRYQARDMEFASVLGGTIAGQGRLKVTDSRHIGVDPLRTRDSLQYRIPHQPALDGNTVEADLELARYAENAVSYQASLLFATGRITTLRTALGGTR
jgi:flagellar basal-body rod protein FlgB